MRMLIYSTLSLSHWGLIPDFQAILYLLASLCLLFDILESYQAWRNRDKHRTKKAG
ncbi:hypothetical protein [Streptococcus danieliae]|nr:hypothetical protein [Streptococcus danieliae]